MGAEMSTKLPRGWKRYDDGNSAIENGTPFRVAYFLHEKESHLYFETSAQAFAFAQDKPEIDRIEIKNVETGKTLFPKDGR